MIGIKEFKRPAAFQYGPTLMRGAWFLIFERQAGTRFRKCVLD